MKKRIIRAKEKATHVPESPDIYGRPMRWDAIIQRIPAGVEKKGAEIGVLYGHTAMRVLRRRPMVTHIMIDPWTEVDPDSDYYKSGDTNATKPGKKHFQAFNLAMKNTSFAGERAVVMRMYSMEAAEKIEDGSLDYVFIDGDHSFSGVKKDIELWLKKVKPGGWIGGHDYDHPILPGVKPAVDSFFSEVETGPDRTWFVKV